MRAPSDIRSWSLKRVCAAYGSADSEAMGEPFRDELLRRLSSSRQHLTAEAKIAQAEARAVSWRREYQAEANENTLIREALGIDMQDPDETLPARAVVEHCDLLRGRVRELVAITTSYPMVRPGGFVAHRACMICRQVLDGGGHRNDCPVATLAQILGVPDDSNEKEETTT